MPEDAGQFLVGTIAVGAGVFASIVGMPGVGIPLIQLGAGQVVEGLKGAPSPESQQVNVAATDAAAPIIYGRRSVGRLS